MASAVVNASLKRLAELVTGLLLYDSFCRGIGAIVPLTRSINGCERISSQAACVYAENDRPDDGHLERLSTGKILVKHNHDEHNTGQAPRPKPPEEQFVRDG